MTPAQRIEDLKTRANATECYCSQYDGRCRNHDFFKDDVKFLTDQIEKMGGLVVEADSIIKFIREDAQEEYWDKAKKKYGI